MNWTIIVAVLLVVALPIGTYWYRRTHTCPTCGSHMQRDYYYDGIIERVERRCFSCSHVNRIERTRYND